MSAHVRRARLFFENCPHMKTVHPSSPSFPTPCAIYTQKTLRKRKIGGMGMGRRRQFQFNNRKGGGRRDRGPACMSCLTLEGVSPIGISKEFSFEFWRIKGKSSGIFLEIDSRPFSLANFSPTPDSRACGIASK